MIFAREVLEYSDNRVKVRCTFPMIPTLAMFIEAAAQSAAAFHQEQEVSVGFLTLAKEITLLSEQDRKEYTIIVTAGSEINSYKQFSFKSYLPDTNSVVTTGTFTLVIPE